jgi:hypothetical protein
MKASAFRRLLNSEINLSWFAVKSFIVGLCILREKLPVNRPEIIPNVLQGVADPQNILALREIAYTGPSRGVQKEAVGLEFDYCPSEAAFHIENRRFHDAPLSKEKRSRSLPAIGSRPKGRPSGYLERLVYVFGFALPTVRRKVYKKPLSYFAIKIAKKGALSRAIFLAK